MYQIGWRGAVAAALAACLLVVGSWLVRMGEGDRMSADTPTLHSIFLTEEGFVPKEIVVRQGDTVRFSARVERPFWPASDLHPGHWLYAAFDPKRPLLPGEEWDFVFEKEGNWRFHDHLDSTTGGTVFVRKEGAAPDSTACTNVADSACWNSILTRALTTYGVNQSLVALERLHRSNKAFSLECHEYAHDLGLQTFRIYGNAIPLHARMSLCNAGFFHGYMEGFFSRYPDSNEAEAFCVHVGTVLGRAFPDAEGQCRHGIGHGAAEMSIPLEPRLWEDIGSLAETPLNICRDTNQTETMRMRCFSGVFSVIKSWALARAKEDAPLISSKHLFAVCAARVDPIEKDACYWEFAKKLARAKPVEQPEDQIILKAIIAPHDYAAYGGMVLRSWATIVGRGGVSMHTAESLISFCRMFPKEFERDCVRGLVEGILFATGPENGVRPALALCGSSLLDGEEKGTCYETLQTNMNSLYSKKQIASFCVLIASEYRIPPCGPTPRATTDQAV